jgi:hypothetical protein
VTVAGVAAYRFASTGKVVAVADGADDEAIHDAWLRSVLPLVVQARGTQVLHASAVSRAGRVLALCGVSTAGKSTLAAALTRQGCELVADDALPFAPESDGMCVYPVPFRLRLREEGHEVLVEQEAPSSPKPLRLSTIVILEPHHDDAPPLLDAVAPADAVGALMPHAYCFALEEGKEELVAAHAALAAAVPVHRLRYPQQLDRLAETVACLRTWL